MGNQRPQHTSLQPLCSEDAFGDNAIVNQKLQAESYELNAAYYRKAVDWEHCINGSNWKLSGSAFSRLFSRLPTGDVSCQNDVITLGNLLYRRSDGRMSRYWVSDIDS